MRRSIRRCLLILTVLLVGSTASTAAQDREGVEVARALLDAFNRHDPAAMAALVTEDFELLYVDDAGRAAVATRGPAALEAEMTAYFEARPDVRSSIEGQIAGTRFVAFRERIAGGASSLAVYEIHEGRVRRAWYYPEEG